MLDTFIPAPAAWAKHPPRHRQPVRSPAPDLPPIDYKPPRVDGLHIANPPRNLRDMLPVGQALELSPEQGEHEWKLAMALLHGGRP